MRLHFPLPSELHQRVSPPQASAGLPWGLAVADIARKALHEKGHILGAAIVPARDLAPLLPLEAVMKAIAVRCHQPHCRRREMDRQKQGIGIRDGR